MHSIRDVGPSVSDQDVFYDHPVLFTEEVFDTNRASSRSVYTPFFIKPLYGVVCVIPPRSGLEPSTVSVFAQAPTPCLFWCSKAIRILPMETRMPISYGVKQHHIMIPGESLRNSFGTSAPIVPDDLVLKILVSKDLIHLDLDVVRGVPVAVDVDRAAGLEQALHLVETGVEPDQVAVEAALPDVGERALLVLVSPDHVVDAVREERRVDVDEVDALRGQRAHHMQVVAPDQAVRLQLRRAEADTLHHLRRQPYVRVVVAEAGVARVPALGHIGNGHVPEARGRAVDALLLRQRDLRRTFRSSRCPIGGLLHVVAHDGQPTA